MTKTLYEKLLESLGKFPNKEEEKQILNFNEQMEKINEQHKHEIGENPLLKDYQTPNFSKYIPKTLGNSRNYGKTF